MTDINIIEERLALYRLLLANYQRELAKLSPTNYSRTMQDKMTGIEREIQALEFVRLDGAQAKLPGL